MLNPLYRKTPTYSKGEVDPVAFYSRELPDLGDPARAKGGWICGGLCCFHADKRKGSFRVNIETGAFRCFSCGASGGDVLDFAMHRYGLDFQDAVSYVRALLGRV